jgi:prolyl oligopeptidase
MFSLTHSPPHTICDPTVEFIHGTPVADPYRWLEDQNSPETRAWIDSQTAYMQAYFSSVTWLESIRQRVRHLMRPASTTDIWSVGGHYYFLNAQEGREQPVIVSRNGLSGEQYVVLDPALGPAKDSIAVEIIAISETDRLLAYSIRQSGTDRCAIAVLDLEVNRVLEDRLADGYYTGFVFAPDGSGFYYARHEAADRRKPCAAVFFHRFGSNGPEDQEIFAADKEGNTIGLSYSPELNILLMIVRRAGAAPPNTAVYLRALDASAETRLLLENFPAFFFAFLMGDQMLAYTDWKAPNFRIVRIDRHNPGTDNWVDVVPESNRRIQQFAIAGGYVFVTRVDSFTTRIEAFSIGGERTYDVQIPPHGTVTLLNRNHTGNKLFFSYTSTSQPPNIYCFDTCEERIVPWDEEHAIATPSAIATEETAYRSKDGTVIPLFLAARRELLHSGALPAFLTGYGGFGDCVTPRFTILATFLMEQGFLLAVPALRGGSELGEHWHLAGKGERRQNAFDDFIAAAEWLASQGRADPGRIAIGGGSNAGLLVGAAITQRPELFRAAICLGPLLDMVRYHLFDFASAWIGEYGCPEDEREFRSLISYSPYHHVKDGKKYPAVLFISGDADDRCNPMHARKMVARLQAATTSGYPILLDYRSSWGHTPVQPLSTKIEALTLRLAFLCQELGIVVHAGRQ